MSRRRGRNSPSRRAARRRLYRPGVERVSNSADPDTELECCASCGHPLENSELRHNRCGNCGHDLSEAP